ncbi:hypothetical protein FE783_35940 [Paenibacillus mesophilus]|uniref:FIMAH domain-containing protein n=1 Tax=Paenibacillus mesophilus TaxID=2582849 RepID=UPI00110E058A|nr:hypothetical protein [Paenibacillus mesophilus]TMV43169.1 hypothetical protein FE783_35940 [Paenibacillus mesophilus]
MLNKILQSMLAFCMVVSMLIVGVSSASAQAKAPSNLLINPGFEMPGEETTPIPGWTLRSKSAGISTEVTDARSYEGTNSLLVNDQSATAANVTYSDPIEINGGDHLRLHAKVTGASGTIYLGIRTFKSPEDNVVGGQLDSKYVSLLPASEWTEYTVEAVAHKDAAYARVLIYTANASTGTAVLDDLHFSVEEVETIPFELVNLGQTVHKLVFNRDGVYTDSSGKSVFYVIQDGDPNILLILDVDTGQVIRSVPVVDTVDGVEHKGAYLRGFTIQPDGTVYMAGTPSTLFKYVPGEDRVHYLKKLPGSATFSLKNGPPGILVGGTYNRNELFEYNILTNELTNLGRATPDEAYAYSVAYDPEHNDYYIGIGSHAHLIRYDRDTGEKTEIPLPERYPDAQFIWDMDVRQGKIFMRITPGKSLAYDLSTGQFEETDAVITSRLVSPVSPEGNRVYFSDGSKLGYYDFGSKQYSWLPVELENALNMMGFAKLSDPEYPGYTLIGMMDGWMLHYNLQNGKSRKLRVPVSGEASTLQTVAKGNDGRMHTSGYITGGNAIYDPLTGEREEYSKQVVGKDNVVPGTQTDRIFSYKDKILFATYGNAKIYEYDQSKPWNRLDPVHPNPKHLFSVSDYQQDRPTAGVIVPDLGKYVVGTVPDYGMLGGALVVYDLETNEREVYRNVIDQQSVTAVTYKDGLVYAGSNIWGGLGIQPTEKEAKLFIWDIEKKEKVFEMVPIPGRRGITEMIVGPDGMIWGSAEGDLFIFNPETRQIVYTGPLVSRSYGSAVWRDAQFVVGTDGNVYGVQANQFFVIDAVTKQKQVIRSVGKRNWLGQDDFGRFYLTEDTELLQLTIPGLVLRPTGARLDVSVTALTYGETADIAITGLLEKGSTIQHMERRNPQYFSSDPSVIGFEDGKLVAGRPGTAEIWARVVMDGNVVETNHVAMTVTATVDTLERSLNAFVQAGEIRNALASQLTNALKQTRHFLNMDERDKALKHLEDFHKHLTNPAMADQMMQLAKDTLLADVQWLIATWQPE